MLVRLGFCSRGLRRLQMKAKLCSTDFLDLGHKYYPMLGSRMPRALLHSPEIYCVGQSSWSPWTVFTCKTGSQTAPSLPWELKETIPSNSFEQHLAFSFINIYYLFMCLGVLGLCCGTQASLVVAHRLSCPMACGILVPQSGLKPLSLGLEGGFLTIGRPGKSCAWLPSYSNTTLSF